MFGIIHGMNLACIVLALICDIAAVKNADNALYRAGERFAVTGHVIATNPQSQNITFWERPDALVVHVTNGISSLRADTRYRLDGHLKLWKGWKRQIVAESLVPLQAGSFPEPIDSSPSRIAENGPDRYGLVRIAGTITKVAEDEADSKYCWLTLKSDEGSIAAFCRREDHPIGSLTPLIGARVRLVGVSRESVTWRQHLPRALMLANHNPIEVLVRAETDPEKLPTFVPSQAAGRQRIDGVVMVRTRPGFLLRYWKSARQNYYSVALVCPSAGQAMPDVGERVTVAGFASFDAYHLKFDEALVKKIDGSDGDGRSLSQITPPEPSVSTISIPHLFSDDSGNRKIAARMHGELVRVRGSVCDLPPDYAGARRIVIEDGGFRAEIDTSALSGELPEWICNGTVVDATGVMTVDYEPCVSAYALPRFQRFTLLPRSADDIRLVRRAPWWTPRRLLAVILALLGVIVWISLWNRALRRLSAKRGEELYRERIAHAAAELKIEERTRLAVEIHDSISQTLTGIALQFDNGADEKVVRQMLASCRHELKCCLWDLRSRTFEEKDMTEAVRRAIGPSAGSARIDVRFNVPRSDLSETTTHAILRIVRELVVNAVRHGKATEVKVAGECHEGTISFSVRDNGTGFDPAKVAGPSTGHFGLQGVRERLNGFGGKMVIESKPGHGTKITSVLSAFHHG